MDAKTGSAFDLRHDDWGRLVLTEAEGTRHVGVEPVRSFPISDPEHWIAICDAEGRELVLVEDLGVLDPQVRAVLDEDLARREFVPVIRQIHAAATDTEPAEWDVVTDRGRTRFVINSSDDIRRLGPHRALIVDAQGMRYLIDDARQLDAASRRMLERYL